MQKINYRLARSRFPRRCNLRDRYCLLRADARTSEMRVRVSALAWGGCLFRFFGMHT